MILFIDDYTEMVTLFGLYFKDQKYIAVHTSDEAYSILRHKPIKLLITDFALSRDLGTDVAAYAKHQMGLPVIIVTAHVEIIPTLRKRFEHVFEKPVNWSALIDLCRKLIGENKATS